MSNVYFGRYKMKLLKIKIYIHRRNENNDDIFKAKYSYIKDFIFYKYSSKMYNLLNIRFLKKVGLTERLTDKVIHRGATLLKIV